MTLAVMVDEFECPWCRSTDVVIVDARDDDSDGRSTGYSGCCQACERLAPLVPAGLAC